MTSVTLYFRDGEVEVHNEDVYGDACAYANSQLGNKNIICIEVKCLQ